MGLTAYLHREAVGIEVRNTALHKEETHTLLNTPSVPVSVCAAQRNDVTSFSSHQL